jgi:hypothetical protein
VSLHRSVGLIASGLNAGSLQLQRLLTALRDRRPYQSCLSSLWRKHLLCRARDLRFMGELGKRIFAAAKVARRGSLLGGCAGFAVSLDGH